MGFKIGPGGGCCCDPEVGCANVATNTLADYTQVAGTWLFGSPFFYTNDANALLVFNEPQPAGDPYGTVSIRLTLPDSGEVRLILAYQDPNNYLFLEVEVTNPGFINYDVWIGHRTGGVDTYLEGSGRWSGNNIVFRLCYNGDRLSADAVGAGVGLDVPLVGDWGTQFAVQTIGIAGTFLFQTPEFYYINGGESGSECSGCQGGCIHCDSSDRGLIIPLTPIEVQLHLIGVANDNCATCVASFDDATFLLETVGPTTPSPFGWQTRSCIFAADTPGCFVAPNDFMRFTYGQNLNPPDTPTTQAGLIISDDAQFEFPRNANRCDEVIVNDFVQNVGAVQQCDWTGVTATITPNIVD